MKLSQLNFFLSDHIYTVPTGPNLTPKRTPKADPRFALGPLRVRFSKVWVRSESARGPLCVLLFVRGTLCALMREADPALLLLPTSPAPCIFQTHCPASSLCSSYWKHTHYSAHCSTVKRFHGEHQQNHQNFALYSAKNCYSCSFTEV